MILLSKTRGCFSPKSFSVRSPEKRILLLLHLGSQTKMLNLNLQSRSIESLNGKVVGKEKAPITF